MIGKLVLWSKVLDVTKGEEALRAGTFSKLSISNPSTAPYGTAAMEVITTLRVYDAVKAKIVQGPASPRSSSLSTRRRRNSASSPSRSSTASARARAGSCRKISMRRSARTPYC